MRTPTAVENVLAAATAVILIGSQFPGTDTTGPVLSAAVSLMGGTANRSETLSAAIAVDAPSSADVAVSVLSPVVKGLSHPLALHDAFVSYFAFKAEHPDQVRKPYLYFVDYGLPSTEPRGYVFDMTQLRIEEGPFTVAHGRGSASPRDLIPTRFSNASGSYATSLGLYLAQETYAFRGRAAGRSYGSIGLRLQGLSEGYNDNARARRVVAHGAPYVTATKSGRSEGCPAMEQARAQRLLPKLADGGLVFLFAPDTRWMSDDPWLAQGSAVGRLKSTLGG